MSTFQPGQATVFHAASEIAQLTRAWRKLARPVVLVPTMGALHAGHLSLVTQAKRIPGALVVVSIFVNPTQFGPSEDLAAYPRTLETDVEKLRAIGADAVFAPAAEEMYPHGPRTMITPGPLGDILEGASRPGHFAGMLTIVHKLMQLSHCTHAIFGEKDYQQLLLVQQMVTDLNLDVQVIGSAIVRETDGLALSSRNAYLSTEQRELALTLSAALTAGAYHAGQGPEAVLAAAQAVLEAQPSIAVDYLELRGAQLGDVDPRGANRLLVAARIGSTRLLDNVGIDFGSEEVTGQPRPS
ncbi:pantoate--beta-alanine ligase [Corynebacterium epidermidicanis]|uniref:Pantothenate synthetase n=1 Tax=Corynebacterium epidermidicanis TaxID=1050174 RepID=A0A0G3GSA2_9CORY|nr:pantoate--beta-alanine ligase [Corynebacterium epidermidicanis]AKK02433.1 pantothenate synthetase [Corynebacterium epidermidicanis]